MYLEDFGILYGFFVRMLLFFFVEIEEFDICFGDLLLFFLKLFLDIVVDEDDVDEEG